MTLAQMESRFFELKGKLAVGQIDEDEFKREMEKLRFQDGEGRWWMIGAQSGRWYYYDGARWLLGQPGEPASTVPPGSAAESNSPPAAVTPPFTPSSVSPPAATEKRTTASTPAPYTAPPPFSNPFGASRPRSQQDRAAPAAEPARRVPHFPSIPALVREEMAHVPPVHAPSPLLRLSPRVILVGAVLVGLVLLAAVWLLLDNVLPGKPISSFLAGSLGASANSAKTPVSRTTPAAGSTTNVDNLIHVADDLVSRSQFAPAFVQYQTAMNSAPNDARVYTDVSRALALAGRIQESVAMAQRAVSLDPKSADAYAQLTRALAWSGKTADAVTAGENAIKLDANNVAAHAFLAEAYLRAGRLDDAVKQADAARKLDDSSADAHRASGWAAVIAANKSEAVSQWQRVVELAPNIFFYHYEFGQVYDSFLGDSASAIPEYQKAIDLYPAYVPSYLALGRSLIEQNQSEGAILQFQKALSFDASSVDAYTGLGLAFQKQDRCSQAIPYFQKALELNAGATDATRGLVDCGALAKDQAPAPAPAASPALGPVPTAIVQATIVPVSASTPAGKGTPGLSPLSATKGHIAFSIYDGQYHLYLANSDGSNRTLVADAASDPVLSPDGSQLLYMSWQRDQRGIHRIRTDGSGDRQLSLHAEDAMPSWSTDGPHYVYETRTGPNSDISKRSYRLRISDPTTKAAQDPTDLIVGQAPAWGPNGLIAFRDCGVPDQRCGLAIMNADGSHKQTLIDNMNAFAPTWSPDGKLIVYMSDYGGNWDIYVINVEGGSPARLTTDPAEDGLPSFSPDGKQIAYLSHSGGVWAVWIMGIDGSNQHKAFELGGDPAGPVGGNPSGQPGQLLYEQRISWR